VLFKTVRDLLTRSVTHAFILFPLSYFRHNSANPSFFLFRRQIELKLVLTALILILYFVRHIFYLLPQLEREGNYTERNESVLLFRMTNARPL